MGYLTDDERNGLYTELMGSRAAHDGTWDAALAALPPAFLGLLPSTAIPVGPRLLQTLIALNTAGRLVDGTVPIEAVFGTLKILTPHAGLNTLVTRLLATIEGESGLGRGGGPPVGYDAGTPEAYTGDADDTLPFEFLRQGDLVGRSVARVIVPRFDGGQPALASGQPRRFKGTAWLVSRELFITNFHVIGARETDEPDPSPGDLELQLGHATLELAYDREGATPVTLAVTAHVALGARGGCRDYAIVRVAPVATMPAPLRLRRQTPSIPKQGYPVNIIQHPQGWPKRIAIRSNLLKSATTTQLEYFGDTLGGSSGSPLCNDAWEVVGLHRASGPATNVIVKGRQATSYNLGIPIGAILAELEAAHRPVFDELAPQIVT